MEIKLSAKAALELKKIIAAQALGPETFLRLILKTSGACAPTYKLELNSLRKETDAVFESRGLVIAVDKDDLESLNGTVIDWREEGLLSGFVVNNPGAKSACGCSKTHK